MFTLRKFLLRLKIWLPRTLFRTEVFIKSLFGDAPYYTKFPPDRRFTIKSSTSPRTIRINVYEPNEFDKDKCYPVHINFHGSGFSLPMFGSDADFCRMVSDRTGAIVLDCDYAKAPEDPFPAAPDDVKDIIDHVVANHEEYFDTSRITIGGFSSGGTLAMTAGVTQPAGTLKAIIAMYAAADLSKNHFGRVLPPVSEGNRNPVPPEWIHLAYDCYVPPGTDLSNPRLSPINTPVSSLPEHMLIVVCDEDPLRDESVDLAHKLKAAGVKVVLKEMFKTTHGWDKMVKVGTPGWEARNEAYDAAVDLLRSVYKSKE